MRIQTVTAAVVGTVLAVAAAAVAATIVEQPPPQPSVAALSQGPPAQEEPEPAAPEVDPASDDGPEPDAPEEDQAPDPADGDEEQQSAEPADTVAPDIEVTFPVEGARFDERTVRFRGRTEPGARVTAGPYAADVADSGEWWITLILAPGSNPVTFTATDDAGNAAQDTVTVTYEPPPGPAPKPDPAPDPKPKPDPKPQPEPTEPAPDRAFTAEQEHDHVEHDPPYSRYRGTGTPGVKVKVWSEYGHAYAKVDANGYWETKVWFEGAPSGTHTWRVVAIHGDQQKEFTYTGTRPEKQQVELTAHQKHEVVEGDPPTNHYWGTAAPHGHVKVWSEYGYVRTEADAAGNWQVSLTFHDAPYGEHTFTVKVWHDDQERAFSLTTVRGSDG